jgi:hypothetical protein
VENSWKPVKHKTVVKSFSKSLISNILDCTEDDVPFEESETSDNNSNECDSSGEDFRGFCDL